MKKPLPYICTRCGHMEHEPHGACDGKSRNQRRAQTAAAPRCDCGNTATSGDTMCGRCRARAEYEREQDRVNETTRTFFARYGEHIVQLRYYECTESFSVEELFQHFKQRLRYDPD